MADEKAAPAKPQKTAEQRIADLELALAAAQVAAPGGTVPYHGGGPEQDVAETWSQADQEAEHAADRESSGRP